MHPGDPAPETKVLPVVYALQNCAQGVGLRIGTDERLFFVGSHKNVENIPGIVL